MTSCDVMTWRHMTSKHHEENFTILLNKLLNNCLLCDAIVAL